MAFGVFLVEFLEHFSVSKSYISWVGSLQLSIAAPAGTTYLTSPLLKNNKIKYLYLLKSEIDYSCEFLLFI